MEEGEIKPRNFNPIGLSFPVQRMGFKSGVCEIIMENLCWERSKAGTPHTIRVLPYEPAQEGGETDGAT